MLLSSKSTTPYTTYFDGLFLGGCWVFAWFFCVRPSTLRAGPTPATWKLLITPLENLCSKTDDFSRCQRNKSSWEEKTFILCHLLKWTCLWKATKGARTGGWNSLPFGLVAQVVAVQSDRQLLLQHQPAAPGRAGMGCTPPALGRPLLSKDTDLQQESCSFQSRLSPHCLVP